MVNRKNILADPGYPFVESVFSDIGVDHGWCGERIEPDSPIAREDSVQGLWKDSLERYGVRSWDSSFRARGKIEPVKGRSGIRRAVVIAGALGLAALVVSVIPDEASASTPAALRSSTRPNFIQFEIGPALNIADSASQFKLSQVFGFHLNGRGSGLAIGAGIQESLGKGIFGFQLGPRVWWDYQPIPGLAFYLTPMGQIGYAVFTNGTSLHFLNMQLGLEPRIVVNDRILLSFRFFTIDMLIGENFSARYDLMFSAGLTF